MLPSVTWLDEVNTMFPDVLAVPMVNVLESDVASDPGSSKVKVGDEPDDPWRRNRPFKTTPVLPDVSTMSPVDVFNSKFEFVLVSDILPPALRKSNLSSKAPPC